MAGTRSHQLGDQIAGTRSHQLGDQQRPVSLYDNLRGAPTALSSGSLNSSGAVSVGNLAHDPRATPSQALCLSTTVPQNIAATTIAGRHTPTRSSLRHSRMIVMTRNGRVPRKYMPPVVHHHRLAKSLVALQVLLGIAVTTLSVWLLLWAPNLPVTDIPHWSGLPLMCSGVLGLFLLCCCRKDYPGMPLACYIFSFKVLSLLMSTLAGIACFCAGGFALVHLIYLHQMSCEPANVLNATCTCRSVLDNNSDTTARVFRYINLNCPEVQNILPILLIGSSGTNFFGGFLVTWYLYIHWASRYSYLYSQVRTSDNRPIVISNKL